MKSDSLHYKRPEDVMVSFYKSVFSKDKPIPSQILAILKAQKNGTYKGPVLKVRQAKTKEEHDKEKKELHAFQVNLSSGRGDKNITRITGLGQFDFDHLTNGYCKEGYTLSHVKARLWYDHNLCIVGINVSPSGDGLKMFLYNNTDKEQKLWYDEMMEYLSEEMGLPINNGVDFAHIDSSCGNPEKMCFVSYDPDALINEHFLEQLPVELPKREHIDFDHQSIRTLEQQAVDTPYEEIPQPQEQAFHVSSETRNATLTIPKHTLSYSEKYVKAFQIADYLWQNNISLLDGYDEYIACVAGIAHDLGEKGYQIARDISAVSKKFDPKEFDKTFNYFLNHSRQEGESCATLGTLFTLAENNGWITNEGQYNYVCPTLERIVDRLTGLPTLLEELVARATTKSEKVVTFVSVVGAVSSVVPNCFFMHGEKGNRMTKYANLAVILLGPSGCGKRMMRVGREVISCINNTVIENSPQNKDQRLKWSVIEPAKVTEAKFITDLEYNQNNINNGSMCIFATEMDSLSKTKKGEHGLSSDILRACAEHEPVEKKVKGMPRDYVREAQGEIILEPKVTQVLTGTFDQVFNFFSNNTDGEMGRYMIINLERESKFISGIESEEDDESEESILEVAKQLGEQYLYKGWEALVNREGRVRFRCTNEQKNYHDELFKPLKDKWEIVSEGFSDFTHRLSPNARKIAMVLTILRYWQRGEYDLPAVIYPTDEDWKLSVDCAIEILSHMYYVYSQPRFNRQRITSTQGPSWQDIYKQMGDTFTRSEFDEACLQAGVGSGTTRTWIRRMIQKGVVYCDSNDVYCKRT